MSDDLAQFLRARLDEDEQAIEAPETWTEFDETQGTRRVDVDHSFERVTACTRAWRGVHIARHDPARVLADVDAKRRLIDWVLRWPMRPAPPSSVDGVLELLALPYADHPDYQETWKP